MKRGTFKQKLTKPLKRSKLKKKSKAKISVIQRRLWELCKQIIRKKYGNICYTCGATGLEAGNWHTSHFIPKASLGAYLKYDLRVLRPSCYHCNINLGGNGAIYYERLRREMGDEYISQIFKDRQVTVNAYSHYEKLLIDYQEILDDLSTA